VLYNKIIEPQDGASRGMYRGEGFELATAGWNVVRAGKGVLLSSTARPEATSTQMDVAESVGQLKQAALTARQLDGAAIDAKAEGLGANGAQADLLRAIDPQQDGKYTGPVNGQASTKASGTERNGSDPVERFAVPAIVMESPENVALVTPKTAVSYAAEHVHLTAQGDAHYSAGATIAGVSGESLSLYGSQGGVKIIANHGPVSVEAHTGAMEVLADQSVRVTSTEGRVDVLAKDAIVMSMGSMTIFSIPALR
jgi:uncharacterized protein (DUF2345 family)